MGHGANAAIDVTSVSEDVLRLLIPCLQNHHWNPLTLRNGNVNSSKKSKRSAPDLYSVLYSILTNKARKFDDYKDHVQSVLETKLRADRTLQEELNHGNISYLRLLTKWLSGDLENNEYAGPSKRARSRMIPDGAKTGAWKGGDEQESNEANGTDRQTDSLQNTHEAGWEGGNRDENIGDWNEETSDLKGQESKLTGQKRANWEGFCPLHCGLYDDKHDYHTCMVTCSRSQ